MPPARDGRPDIATVIDLVRAAEAKWAGPSREGVEVSIPGAGPCITSGIVHEWFGPPDEERERWTPPLCVFAQIGALALAHSPDGHVVWIGWRCRPEVHILARAGPGRSLLRRSVFIDPPDAGARLWAIDLALRCPAVVAVVADGSGCPMGASRRLQLAAGTGRALALIARPPHERRTLSAAGARWMVQPEPSPTRRPRWTVELLRCKGVQPSHGTPRRWAVELDHAQGLVALPAGLAARPAEAAAPVSRLARTA